MVQYPRGGIGIEADAGVNRLGSVVQACVEASAQRPEGFRESPPAAGAAFRAGPCGAICIGAMFA